MAGTDIHLSGQIPAPLSPLGLNNKKQRDVEDDRGVRMSRIARWLLILSEAAALCIVAAKFIVPSAIPSAAVAISAVALTIFVLNRLAKKLGSFLPPFAQRLANHIRAFVKEVFALLAVIMLYPLGFISFEPKSNKTLFGQPILLVHGYLHNSSAWLYMKRRLKAEGFGPLYTINLGSPLHSIEEYAEQVKEKAQEIARQTGRSDLTIIGHSMGGLVGSYYAANLAPQDTVKNVITLGSPLNGTKLAGIGIGECAKEMRYQSNFVKALNEAISRVSTRFFNITSQSDLIVVPNDSAKFSDPKCESNAIPDLGHISYLFSDSVADNVLDYLQRSSHSFNCF